MKWPASITGGASESDRRGAATPSNGGGAAPPPFEGVAAPRLSDSDTPPVIDAGHFMTATSAPHHRADLDDGLA